MTQAEMKQFGASLENARGIVAITPSDTVDLTAPIIGIYNGDTSAGDVNVICLDGSTGVIPNIPAGHIFPCCITRVKAASTTITNLIGLKG